MTDAAQNFDLPKRVTQSDFARILAVNRSYVSKLKHQGKLVLVMEADRELVDVAATHARLVEGSDPSRWHLAEWNRRQRELHQSPGGGAPPQLAASSKNRSFWDAKTRGEQLTTALKEVELAKVTELVVDRAGVETAAFEFGRAMRDALLPLVGRLAPSLAQMTDTGDIRRLLDREIREAMGAVRMPAVVAGDVATVGDVPGAMKAA